MAPLETRAVLCSVSFAGMALRRRTDALDAPAIRGKSKSERVTQFDVKDFRWRTSRPSSATGRVVTPIFRLGRIAGVQVGANWSVLVILTLIVVGLAAGWLPLVAPGAVGFDLRCGRGVQRAGVPGVAASP